MILLTISVLTQVSPFMYIAKCYRKLLDPADQAILQSDLDAIVDWSELRGMPLNVNILVLRKSKSRWKQRIFLLAIYYLNLHVRKTRVF